MSGYSATHQPTALPSPLLQTLFALAGGVALFIFGLMAVVIGYDINYAGVILPGVSVAGIDLSGQTPDQAAGLLAERIAYPQTGRIVFQDGQQVWIARPADLGLTFDAQTTARAAYLLGRQGNPLSRSLAQFEAWYSGRDLAPLLIYDERVAQRYLEAIAAQIDLPVVEASLQIDGVNVVATPGQIGRRLERQTTLAPLEEHLRSLSDSLLPLVVIETPPDILDASQQAETARQILSAPLVLNLPDAQPGDPGPWTVPPEKLAAMLTIERAALPEGARYQIGLNAEGLRSFLEELAPSLRRFPSDARFIFNDETRQLDLLQPAVIGRALNVDGTLQAVNEKLSQGEHNIALALDYTQPAVPSEATAQQLGVVELVAEQTSYFYGSSAARIQNIQTAAARFHGVLVPPGAVFSMAEVLGDVSLDNGYAEALIIYGNRTIQGVGGGVCQVSTTLFRTVFFAGFPVVERHPHAYRVGYYELNAANQVNSRLAGLDATVFVPVVDFKFKNDTDHWLLMETYTNPAARTLTWKFYSTPDGRSVDWDTTGLRNVVDPPDPVYQENPRLGQGEVRQVDWAVEGADVTVSRTVYRGGQVFFEDSFSTHYLPWAAVYEYGPGTEIDGVDTD